MAHEQKTSLTLLIICRPGQSVKARVVGAGLPLGKLARAAGMAQSTLSCYLSGRTRNAHSQLRIAAAFRKLSGQYLTTPEFWGDLWAESAA